MTTPPLIFRAAHLHLFIGVFREIGVPVEQALARSPLPRSIETQPDAYVSLPLALPWMAHTGRDLTTMELGYLGSRDVSLGALDVRLQSSILSAVSGLQRLEHALRLATIEDSALVGAMRWEGEHLRVSIAMPRLARHPHACLVEWVNLQAMIAVVRSVAGPAWAPQEMTLVSRAEVPGVALEEFGMTRVRSGHPLTSILVEREALLPAGTLPHRPAAPLTDEAAPWTFAAALRSAIQPYVVAGEVPVSLPQVAELVGTSPRTLQRRLKVSGTTYAQIVQQARFDLARQWLGDASLKVGEIAAMAGYENPQHFSRAFRKLAGVTPSDYRLLTAAR